MNRRKLYLSLTLTACLVLAIAAGIRGEFSDAATTITVTRGPYLQMMSPHSVIVRWQTNVGTDSRVRYGRRRADLNAVRNDFRVKKWHMLKLRNLRSATRYFYSIGSSTQVLRSGGTYNFRTAPLAGQSVPLRIWVLGDAGTGNSNAAAVRRAYYRFTQGRYTNLMLLLGDNAYRLGRHYEYDQKFFRIYALKLRQAPVFSALGNHDTAFSTDPPRNLPYFNIFNFPKFAELGGISSGTEAYYSFDYGNIHFVSIDSVTSSVAPGGRMLTWLNSDLADNRRMWTIAFWHHPPYSKGSHDSDTESKCVKMRENVLPILESYGVDLVLTGHSHSYERSYLINGHYGSSNTFKRSKMKNAGSGQEDESGAYVKQSGPHGGTVYVVTGSAGQAHSGAFNHPAMFTSRKELGSFAVDVSGNKLDAKFVRSDGAITDYFTIRKY